MSDMVERVRAAIERTYDVDCGGDILNLGEVARAVIAALREPTPAMVEAFVERALKVRLSGDYTWADYARDQWQDMIDKALEEAGE